MPNQVKKPEPVVLAELPPFPAVVVKALQYASDSEMRLRELHDVVCVDPVFAHELLSAANAPIYGTSKTFKSTLQAAIFLGYNRLKGLVLTVGTKAYLGSVLEIPALRACWHHSLACAIVAEELVAACRLAKSDRWRNLDKDVVYTAGIIHDVGRLALAVLRPAQYANFLQSMEKEPCDVQAQERAQFGFDHCQAGHSLVAGWELPAEFLDIVSHHHDAEPPKPSDALGVIHFSCMMASALGFEAVHGNDFRTYEELLKELSRAERLRFGQKQDECVMRIADRIYGIETA